MSGTRIPAHTDSVLCCEIQPSGKLLASGGEVTLNLNNDLSFISLPCSLLPQTQTLNHFPSPSQDGNLCLINLTSLQTIARLPLNQAKDDVVIPSLAFHPTDPHSLFAAAGNSILHLDLRKSLSTNISSNTSSSPILHKHTINQDEINCIKINHKATWLAAADDSGEITLLDLSSSSSSSSPKSKMLRRVHNNICSTVAFRSHRPWEVMSGGLDAMMVRCDFSRLKTVKKWNIATEAAIAANGASSEQQQFINPPMVHCIATPYGDDVEDRSIAKLVVVARGDGCVAVYDGDGTGSGNTGGGQQRGRQRTKKKGGKNKDKEDKVDGPLAVLRSDNGGHTSSANCVEFVHGCGWQRVVSGGNDGRCVVWKWEREREMSCNEEEETSCSKENGGVEVNKGRKVNCVCSSDNVGGYNLFIGDVDGNILAKTV